MFWISKDTCHTEEIRVDFVTGCRKPIDFFSASISLFGSLGGLLVAASSYDGMNYLYFISYEFDPGLISFLPQGATIMVYSTMFLFLSFSWWLLIFWNVGSGYDLFDKKTRTVLFFRYGFPGKNRRIFTKVLMDDIQAIIVQSKVGNSKDGKYLRGGVLYIQTREQGAFALTPIDDYWDPFKVAQKAGELCRFLRVPIEIF
uniref:Photosystem I assembly protein Ycf4 n=2 Tax=50 kb inversion clade TaxID=2231393 RepID=A0A1C7D3W1_ROBPS|nr:photosystem I assembly protein ycf4 [Robinia pseudoacacia]AHY33400.1 photosystem I assembly protein ycf4 [Robinia pseudoacacia]QJQ79295.1 photosystem I assembly protein Ycf4 [Robinia pseudoacacia]QWW33511.1 photosystem I assembly protein Ycf4 [Maackia amurensis]UWV18675.1 photosystem I assembly protein Ycf4 [Robinia pseudoacacia]